MVKGFLRDAFLSVGCATTGIVLLGALGLTQPIIVMAVSVCAAVYGPRIFGGANEVDYSNDQQPRKKFEKPKIP